jgi:hypothetical protein
MQYAAHQARLSIPDRNGVPQRAHLEGLLDNIYYKGRTAIERALAGPEFPEALRYLWDRFLVLHGMRAQAVQGLAPFTPEMLYAADRLFRWRLSPIEVEGLRALDVVTRHPESLKDEDVADEAV